MLPCITSPSTTASAFTHSMPSSPKSKHPSIWRNRTRNIFLFSGSTLVFLSSSFLLGVVLGPCTRSHGTWSVRVLWQNNAGDDEGFKGVKDMAARDLSENVYVNVHGNDVTTLGVTRPGVMAFVGIMTGYNSSGRRQSLRNTWMPSDQQSLLSMEEATGLAFRFIIGKTNNKARAQELQTELLKHDDFMVLDFDEEHTNSPYKTYSFFKAAYAIFDCDYYVKVEDDIYLRPDRLSLLLAKDRPHPKTYLGCMSKNEAFSDYPALKLSDKRLIGKEHVLHAQRSIYALSADIVADLLALGHNSLRMFHSEDVAVGVWMLAFNVNYEDNKLLCQSKCSSRSIAVTDFPNCSGLCDAEERLSELHGQAVCSRSPTYPENQALRFQEWANLVNIQATKDQRNAQKKSQQ